MKPLERTPYKWEPVKREELRVKLFHQQRGFCHLCKFKMTLDRKKNGDPGRLYATFDHLTPYVNGGTIDEANLKLAHRECNNARGDMSIDGFRETAEYNDIVKNNISGRRGHIIRAGRNEVI